MAAAPRGRFGTFYNDYFILGYLKDVANGESIIGFSGVRNAYSWPTGDRWNIETHNGEEIKAINQEGPFLSIFKESSRTLIRGNFFDQTSSSFDGRKEGVLQGVGALSHTGIVRVGHGDRGLLYVPENEGIYLLSSGVTKDLITKDIPKFWGAVNKNAGWQIHGVHWPEMNWILWSLPMHGAGTPNYILCYDYVNRGFWPWEITSRSMIDFVEDDGVRHIYIGDDTGFVYDLWQSDKDSGSAIDSYVDWPVVGKGTRNYFKFVEQLRVQFKNTGTHKINVRVVADGRFGGQQTTTVAQTETVGDRDTEAEQYIATAQRCRTLQARFSNTTGGAPWGVREVEPMGRMLGLTR